MWQRAETFSALLFCTKIWHSQINIMIKAILLDADGVLMHGEWFSTRLSEKFGVPMEKIMPFFNNEFVECELGRADLKETIKPYLAEWGWKGTMDELLSFWFDEGYKLDSKAIELVKEIKKDKILVLATNQEEYRVEFMKKQMGLEKIFDFTVGSYQAGYFKDNPEFYKYIFGLLPEIKPEEMLFLDDREKNIKVAESLGIKAVLYKNLEDLKNIS
jgi:putative hydrolase of the HAD superfamily